MFHMPPTSSPRNDTYPLLIQHALLDSSWAFTANPAPFSLAYTLVEAGYDCWFGNNRGNLYATNHTNLDVDSDAFWNFTYDEMASLDLPAELNYVLKQTGAKKVNYIGHSEGTLQAFAELSQNDVVRQQINFATMLGPVAYIKHMTSPIFVFLADFRLDEIIYFFNGKSFLDPGMLNEFGEFFCKLGLVDRMCDIVLELFCGRTQNVNTTRIPVYVSETPSGTSVRNMVHWGQGYRDGKFQKYDWGRKGNEIEYGQKDPPAYDLSKVTTPIALLSGSHDILADPRDVKTLAKELPNVVFFKEYDGFAHLDFTWGTTSHSILYPDILQLLNTHGKATD